MKLTIDEINASNVPIGIIGSNKERSHKIRILLQTFGYFCRVFTKDEQLFNAVNENLVQFVLILNETAEDISKAINTSKTIRESYSSLELPVIIISVEEHFDILHRELEGVGILILDKKENQENILSKYQLMELVSRIRNYANVQNLYFEKQSLIKSESEKRAFLYLITHNVNTPLTVLLNEIYSLSQINFKDESITRSINNIHKASNQIDMVIQNVLASYKISDGKYMLATKTLNLCDILEIMNMFLEEKAQFKNQSFEFICKEKDLTVECDENSIKGIYVNLVDNAIKYSPADEGKIKVELWKDEEGVVVLQVSDNGCGIPKEKQLALFNRFENIGSRPTGSEKSLGLGLYVVNELCELNNLALSYKKKEEGGSIFTVRFNGKKE